MNTRETLSAFLAAARHLAMEMAGNAQYIRNELSRVALPPGLGEILEDACDELVSVKFDTIPALADLDDLAGTGGLTPDEAARAASILHHLDAAAVSLHPVVMTLREAAEEESRYFLAFLLVTESAVNLLNAHEAIPRISEG